MVAAGCDGVVTRFCESAQAPQDLKVQKDKYKAEAKDLEADVRVLTEMSRQYDDLASSMSDAQVRVAA